MYFYTFSNFWQDRNLKKGRLPILFTTLRSIRICFQNFYCFTTWTNGQKKSCWPKKIREFDLSIPSLRLCVKIFVRGISKYLYFLRGYYNFVHNNNVHWIMTILITDPVDFSRNFHTYRGVQQWHSADKIILYNIVGGNKIYEYIVHVPSFKLKTIYLIFQYFRLRWSLIVIITL